VEDSLNEIASGMHRFYSDKVARKAAQQANALKNDGKAGPTALLERIVK
jgi:hypothetical protein